MDIPYGQAVYNPTSILTVTQLKLSTTESLGNIIRRFLVDSFPFLKYIPEWMPGAGFKRKAREWSRISQALFELLPKAAKKRIVRYSFFSRK